MGADGAPDLAKQPAQGERPTPFAVLGLPRRIGLDTDLVALQARGLIRGLHPDRFFREGQSAVAAAERHTALVNDALRIVRDFTLRVQWLLDNEPATANEAFVLPPALALDFLEWNEAIDTWQADPLRYRQSIAELHGELSAKCNELTQAAALAAQAWDTALDAQDVGQIPPIRQQLRAHFGTLTYYHNLLRRLAALAPA